MYYSIYEIKHILNKNSEEKAIFISDENRKLLMFIDRTVGDIEVSKYILQDALHNGYGMIYITKPYFFYSLRDKKIYSETENGINLTEQIMPIDRLLLSKRTTMRIFVRKNFKKIIQSYDGVLNGYGTERIVYHKGKRYINNVVGFGKRIEIPKPSDNYEYNVAGFKKLFSALFPKTGDFDILVEFLRHCLMNDDKTFNKWLVLDGYWYDGRKCIEQMINFMGHNSSSDAWASYYIGFPLFDLYTIANKTVRLLRYCFYRNRENVSSRIFRKLMHDDVLYENGFLIGNNITNTMIWLETEDRLPDYSKTYRLSWLPRSKFFWDYECELNDLRRHFGNPTPEIVYDIFNWLSTLKPNQKAIEILGGYKKFEIINELENL